MTKFVGENHLQFGAGEAGEKIKANPQRYSFAVLKGSLAVHFQENRRCGRNVQQETKGTRGMANNSGASATARGTCVSACFRRRRLRKRACSTSK